MSIDTLPQRFKPETLCKNAPPAGSFFKGEFEVPKIQDLNPELKKQALTPVRYSLRFYMDKEGAPVIEGDMEGDFELICQRCLKPMIYTIKAKVLVSPVASDSQAKLLTSKYDPLLMDDGEINFAEWIAEELHLALPLVPRHESACLSHESYIQDETGE